MFRTLLQGSRRAYTCSCLYQPSRLIRLPTTIAGHVQNQKAAHHTTPTVSGMNKELKGNKTSIRIGQAFKQEPQQQDEVEDEIELIGLSEAGVTIPTLETHQMLIDGVPFSELPIVHIKSSLNNTIMTATDCAKDFILTNSCGREGFKNVKKSTNVAAQATGLSLGLKLIKKGITSVRIIIRGIGAGRLASIKGLQMAGVKIVSLTDDTPIPFNGCRPQKVRRI